MNAATLWERHQHYRCGVPELGLTLDISRMRFDGSENYFKPKDDVAPDQLRGLAMRRTNLVPDIFNAELYLDNRRSPGYRRLEPALAGNVFYQFVGEHITGAPGGVP